MIIISVFVLIGILGVLIFLHELGHFFFAKWSKAVVNEFSIGIGPSLIRFKALNTPIHIRMFPIGGYVSLIGEMEDEGPGSFVRLSIVKQFFIILGGIIFNLISAYILLFIYLLAFNWRMHMPITIYPHYAAIEIKSQQVGIAGLSAASAMKNYSDVIQKYPVLKAINNHSVYSINELKSLLSNYRKGDSINVVLSNRSEDKIQKLTIKLQENHRLGILVSEYKDIYWNYSNIFLLSRPLAYSYDFIRVSYIYIKGAVSQALKQHNTQSLEYSIGGPLSILPVLDSTLQSGHPIIQLIGLLGILSLNLAIMNAIPFPGLDGWHLLLIFLRKFIKSKEINTYFKYLTYGGLLILLLLSIIITLKDLRLVFSFYGK